jgi:hypothetical protein
MTAKHVRGLAKIPNPVFSEICFGFLEFARRHNQTFGIVTIVKLVAAIVPPKRKYS